MDFDVPNSYNDDDCWAQDDFDGRDDRGFRNRQYSNAFGDYRGGYGPVPLHSGPPGPPGPPMFPPRPRMGPPRMFLRGPMGPPPMILGRGFGPNGPPVQRARGDPPAIRYLIRCGIPKNNVKSLPKDLLDLIEPHYCGLCGHNFESFSLSRIHYVSKQHQKSVKKWLGHNNSMSKFNPREAPLRSRELYCEICDVQITSKVHADSHYIGKSHKAVVEGRKNPKNPMLLQPGMERRFKKLIRREKKFLKLQSETELKEDEKEPKDVKTVQPELYCDICKTSVTCTEQMTAHLNGKRHLTKEKNYILKSMRGEIETPAAGDEAEDEAGGEAEENSAEDNPAEENPAEENPAEGDPDEKNPAEENPTEDGGVRQEAEWNENW